MGNTSYVCRRYMWHFLAVMSRTRIGLEVAWGTWRGVLIKVARWRLFICRESDSRWWTRSDKSKERWTVRDKRRLWISRAMKFGVTARTSSEEFIIVRFVSHAHVLSRNERASLRYSRKRTYILHSTFYHSTILHSTLYHSTFWRQ